MNTRSLSIFTILSALFTISLSCMEEQRNKEIKLRVADPASSRNASPDRQEDRLKTLAFTVTSIGDLEFLKHLVNNENVDANSLDKKGTSLLQVALCHAFAVKNPEKSNPILEFLTQKKAFINRCKPGQDISAIKFATSLAIRDNYLAPLEFLLSKGANPFFRPNKESTSAAFNLTVARTLPTNETRGLDKIADLFATKATTLAHALDLCNLSLVKKFATRKSVQEKDSGGRLPLEILVRIWDKKIPDCAAIADVLFENKADPHAIIDDIGTTCSLLATCKTIKEKDIDLLKQFLKNGVDPNYRAHPLIPSLLEMAKITEALNGKSPVTQEVMALLENHQP